ncbi:MAG: GNAT family N-acetyltransferase [Beijerinckiaceae bacterium]
MSQFSIRQGRVRDLDRLVEIEKAAFETDLLSRESFAHALESKASLLLVATRESAADGYALLHFRSNSKKCRLFSLARHPGAPHGCGRALLAGAERAARRRGLVAMRLEVRETNAPAIALYEGAGFRRIGRYENYYEDGAPALRFEKALVKAPARGRAGKDRKPPRRAAIR